VPLLERRAIAAFLDRETAMIDALAAPIEDSGVEWLARGAAAQQPGLSLNAAECFEARGPNVLAFSKPSQGSWAPSTPFAAWGTSLARTRC